MILRIGIQQTLTPNERNSVALLATEIRKPYLAISISSFFPKDFYVMYEIHRTMNPAECVEEGS